MKTYKYFSIIAAALAMGACSSDDLVGDTQSGDVAEGETAVFTSTIVEDYTQLGEENMDGGVNATTRSTLNTSSLEAIWQEGDKVTICDGTLNYTYKVSETGHTCSFEVIDNEHKGLAISNGAKFCAFYPQAAVSGWNGNTVSAMIYTEQDYQENYSPTDDLSKQTFGGYMAAPAGEISGENVSFKFNLVSSIVDVNLASFGKDLNTIEAVYLKANNGETLAGQLKYNCDTKTITVDKTSTGYTTSSQSDVICVHVGGNMTNGATGEAAYVRFYTLPVAVSGGFTVTVKTTDGTYYTKSTSSSVGGGSTVAISGADNGTACKPYYKRLGFGAYNANNCRTGCWMATIPSNTHFNMMSLPGSHNSATSSVSSNQNQAKTQQYTIQEQLEMGVRAFDLRPRAESNSVTKDDIVIWHGSVVTTGVKFKDALSTITTFLKNNPTETVFIRIRREETSEGNFSAWQNAVSGCIDDIKDYIQPIPTSGNLTLNDAKGKIVMISSDNIDAEAGTNGVGKCGWGSSFGDKTVVKGMDNNGNTAWILVYQDEYTYSSDYSTSRIANIEKLQRDYIEKNETNANRIYVNTLNVAWEFQLFSNSSEIPKTTPVVNNSFVTSEYMKNANGRFGVVFADYIGYASYNGDKVLNMIINQNYKYLYRGRTRNVAAPGSGIGIDVAGDDYADDTQVYAPKR